jgi:beta-glucuronidase
MMKRIIGILLFTIVFVLTACTETPPITDIDCDANPTHEDCVIDDVDCDVTPDHEDCQEDPVDCTVTPEDPSCETEDPYVFNVSDPELTLNQFTIEPMRTEIQEIDGINVLFQYDQVVPAFDNWEGNTDDRGFLSLNGDWKFTFDPENVGVEEQWYNPEYDVTMWDDRQIPSSWDLYDNEYFATSDNSMFGQTNAFTDGYAWFRRTFEVSEDELNQVATIHFLSVSYRSWIYVNGTYVEAHDSGEDAFAFDISPYLKEGSNFIAVRVYRKPTAQDYFVQESNETWSYTHDIQQMPVGGQDWWPYAGITRDVYIEYTNPVFVSKVLVHTQDSNLTLHAVITNTTDETVILNVLFYPDQDTTPNTIPVTIDPDSVKVVSRTIPIAQYQEWSLDTPYLYTSIVALEQDGERLDSLETTYGNREIEIIGNKLYLNGNRIWLKGTNWHEETSESGRSMRKDEYDFEYDMIQDLGFNFIRNSVYNRHPYAYELANKRGLLILDEAQNMWMTNSAIEYQYETYRLHYALQAKTVWNQMNHPSVIMWGLMNETSSGSYQFYNYTKELVDVTKLLDLEDRPTIGAFRTSQAQIPAQGLMDIIGINEYFGFHHGEEEDLEPFLDWLASIYPDKPIMITESGAWSTIADMDRQRWHAEVYRTHYGAVADRSDSFIGHVFWVLKDYKARRDYSSRNNGVSGMGVVPFDHTQAKVDRMEELGLLPFAYKLVYQQIQVLDNPMDEPGFE